MREAGGRLGMWGGVGGASVRGGVWGGAAAPSQNTFSANFLSPKNHSKNFLNFLLGSIEDHNTFLCDVILNDVLRHHLVVGVYTVISGLIWQSWQ